MATLFFCELSSPARSALLVRSARSACLVRSARPARLALPAGKSAQNPRFCARKAIKWRSRRPKAHKNPNFVLEMPENGGSGPQKRTKTPILCSKSQKMGVPKAKSAQKPRFCAREDRDWHQGEGKLASREITMAFLQITAHASKIQIPYIQTINFWSRAR